MKNKFLNKYNLVFLVIGVLALVILAISLFASKKPTLQTQSLASSTVNTQIMAKGTVRSLNEANLHFQTGGKITYLPFKKGDYISAGQTVASLDSYSIQKQLEIALNNFRSTKDTVDQQNANINNNVYQSQQKSAIDLTKPSLQNSSETEIINDMAKRIADQNQSALDNSVIQVQLANYAFSLASLTSPIAGVLIHEDADNPNVNISPAATFLIADPNALVFRANVPEDEISYIAVDETALVYLSGNKTVPLPGTVLKVYPEKITLPTGENVYQVDISIDGLSGITNYNQDGEALITNRYERPVTLVPSWLVIGNEYIWIEKNGNPILKKITTGDTINGKTVINTGLTYTDKIILNPQAVAQRHYMHL